MSNPNDSAYPFTGEPVPGAQMGLSKRELFAAMALQGMLANPRVYEEQSAKNVLSDAVGMAEALIAELDKAEKK